jgi:hypothetical protein
MVTQNAWFCCTAQGQQEKGIGFDHLVGFHGGQGTGSLYLQWFSSRLFDLAMKE